MQSVRRPRRTTLAVIYFYATNVDAALLLAWLNSEPDLMFLVPDGPSRWRAADGLPSLQPGTHDLWHRQGGQLSLVRSRGDGEPPAIEHPESGWTELVSGADVSRPWFPTSSALFELNYWPEGNPHTEPGSGIGYLGVCSFGWVGSEYTGSSASDPHATTRWWRRLRGWFSRQGVRVPGRVPRNSPEVPILALPDAFRLVEQDQVRRYAGG